MSAICYLCNKPVNEHAFNKAPTIKCNTCGTYKISERAVRELHERGLHPDMQQEIGYKFSGVTREYYENDRTFFIENIEQLETSVSIENDPLESINFILKYLYNNAGSANDFVQLDLETDYPIAYAKNPEELQFFLDKASELNYLEENFDKRLEFRLTLNGWKIIKELDKKSRKYDQAFVAMSFNKEREDLFKKGIEPALKKCGYKVLRVDMTEHNDKIDNKIIAEIRKSGIVIADFTDQKNGVYFEAGFAMGLGVPVIWSCNEDEIDNLHFDTRQYNHIPWETPKDLEQKLINRIEATIPDYPNAT